MKSRTHWDAVCARGVLVQLIPEPQQMANNLQRQGRSARLVERRICCTDELLAGWKFADAQSEGRWCVQVG